MDYAQDPFLNSIAEELMCPICTEVVQDPFQCFDCDTLTCQGCAKQVSKCPNCNKQPFRQKKLSRLLNNILDKIKQKSGQYLQVGITGCPLKGCYQKVDNQDLAKHFKQKCQKFIILKQELNLEELQNLQEENNQLKQQNESYLQQIKEYEEEIEAMKEQISNMEQIQEENQELNEITQNQAKSINEFKRQIEKLNQTKKIQQQQLSDLINQNKDLQDSNDFLKRKEEKRDQDINQQIQNMKQQNDQYQQQFQELQDLNLLSQYDESHVGVLFLDKGI